MASCNRESVRSSISITLSMLLLFVGNNVANYVVNIFSDKDFSLVNIAFLIVLTILIYFIFVGYRDIFHLLMRWSGLSRLSYLKARINDMRSDIHESLSRMSQMQEKFHQDADSARTTINTLRADDVNFTAKKSLAETKVKNLQIVYDENIATLESLVGKLNQDIDAAMHLFANYKRYSQEDANEFYEK